MKETDELESDLSKPGILHSGVCIDQLLLTAATAVCESALVCSALQLTGRHGASFFSAHAASHAAITGHCQ